MLISSEYEILVNAPRIVLTPKCNCRCSFCHNEGFQRDEEWALSPNFPKVLNAFSAFGVDGTCVTGGEPLLFEELDRTLDMIVNNLLPRFRHLTTNGLLLNDRNLGILDKHGFRRLNVSVQGMTRKSYAAIMGVDGFSTVVENIRSAVAAGFVVHVNTMLLKGVNTSSSALRRCIEFWQARGVASLDLIFPYPTDRPVRNSVVKAGLIRERLAALGLRGEVSRSQYRPPKTSYRVGDMGVSLRDFIPLKDPGICGPCPAWSYCEEGISNPRLSLAGRLKMCFLCTDKSEQCFDFAGDSDSAIREKVAHIIHQYAEGTNLGYVRRP